MPNPNRRSSLGKAFNFIKLNHINGPRGFDFLKYVRFFQKDILGAFRKVHEDFGDIASFGWPMNSIIIYSPSIVKGVLVDHGKSFIKGEQIEELRAVVGNGLATNNDHESWLKSRSLLAREFNSKSVALHIKNFEEITKEHFKNLKSGEVFDACESAKLLTFKIAMRTFLGTDIEDKEALSVNDAVSYTSKITYLRIFQLFPLPYWFPTMTNLVFEKHYRKLESIVMKLIKNERQNPISSSGAVLQKLVHAKDDETGFSFSDDELRDEVLTLLIAGHETSAHTLAWCLGLLAKYPEIQKKLYQEIINSNQDINSKDLFEKYPYLKLVILETMRLYPAFPVLSRKAATDVEIDGIKVPKNTNVVIPIFVMQRSDKHFDKPDDFIPERFIDPQKERSFSFLPFSKGQRRCIAELFAMSEMAVILIEILGSYEVKLTSSDLPEAEALVSLKPVKGMPLKFLRRI